MRVLFIPLLAALCGGVLPLCAERLSLGVEIEREPAPGEMHSYYIDLRASEFTHIEFLQEDSNARVRVTAPDGSAAFDFRACEALLSEIPISLLAPATGAYRIDISFPNGAAGRNYKLRVEALRPREERDTRVIDAERQTLRAWTLYLEAIGDARRKALPEFESALRLWHALGDKPQESNVLLWIGRAHRNLGELALSRKYFGEALELARDEHLASKEVELLMETGIVSFQLGERKLGIEQLERARSLCQRLNDLGGEAAVLSRLGRLYVNSAEPNKAIEAYARSLELARKAGGRRTEASTLNNLGVVFVNRADYASAIENFNQAIDIWGSLGVRAEQGGPLGNLGFTYSQLGDAAKALDYLGRALAVSREIGDRTLEGYQLLNIGATYGQRGEYQKALDYIARSAEVWRAAGNRQMEAQATGNIGKLYLSMGDVRKAMDHLERALPIRREVGDQRGVGINLFLLGGVYVASGDNSKALDYYQQSLAVRRKLVLRPEEAESLAAIALAQARSADPKNAFEPGEAALALARQISVPRTEATALQALATASLRTGDVRGALERVSKMLAHSRQFDLVPEQREALILQARAELVARDLERARECVVEALQLSESVRGGLGGTGLRLTYQAGTRETYEFLIDVLMRLDRSQPGRGYNAEALAASEKARARVLLDILGEAGAELEPDADSELVDRVRNLRSLLQAKTEQRIRLLSGPHTTSEAAGSEREIQKLVQQYEEQDTLIRARHPRYAGLSRPQPLTAAEIQHHVAARDTVLLEYALGTERSYLWAVTPDVIESFELPARSKIDSAVQACYREVSRPPAGRERTSPCLPVSHLLLNPVRHLLSRNRVVIVADGSIQYLPFPSLNDPARPELLLIARHEVVSLPSASVLPLLRGDSPPRSRAAKQLAVIADPVFQREDPRVPAHGTNPGHPVLPADLARSASDVGVLSLERLRGSRKEAESIISLAQPGSVFKALDFDASRNTVLSPVLAPYRILHFATHGIVNSQHPELSGLVLSLFDRDGQPQSGFLQAHEIYGLELSADLVVLSACQTAIGKDVRGEGLIGLSRGFMYAGVPRVIASLWRVPDRPTAELMRRFYRAMLVEHQRPAAALRTAQAAMHQDARWGFSYYWAGFILQGEWK